MKFDHRKRIWFGLGVVFNFLLPWAVYRLIVPQIGETHAIMASAAVPAAWSLVQFARSRKVDAMSVLVLSGIALSLMAIALGGSPKLLLFRESLITGLIGLVLIGSAIVGRPLMFVMLRAVLNGQSLDSMFPRGIAVRARGELESYADRPWFQRVMSVMTIVFGLIAVAETAVLCVLVFSLPTDRVLIARPIVRYVTAGLLILWTFLYAMPAVRRGEREDERIEETITRQ